jgi:hypothetical protein
MYTHPKKVLILMFLISILVYVRCADFNVLCPKGMYMGFWWGNRNENYYWKHLNIGGRSKLKWILEKTMRLALETSVQDRHQWGALENTLMNILLE